MIISTYSQNTGIIFSQCFRIYLHSLITLSSINDMFAYLLMSCLHTKIVSIKYNLASCL